MYRHGDVFLAPADAIPPESKRLPHCTLAEGEATGHCHRIRETNVAELFEHGSERFLRVLGPGATLIHPEHAEISLPAGTYRVWLQREYHPHEVRHVVD